MELLGAIAGTLQLIQALMEVLDEVRKVYHEIRDQDETLKEFDADTKQKEMTLSVFEGVVRTASKMQSPNARAEHGERALLQSAMSRRECRYSR